MAQKIPATIVTGFLGSGKTTLIRHMLQNAGGRRIALIINEFGDLGVGSRRAQCELGSGTPRIVVDRKYWEGYNEDERRMIMLHELGHCVLFRMHKEDEFDDGTPYSLMNPLLFDESLYLSSQEHYLHELFHEH